MKKLRKAILASLGSATLTILPSQANALDTYAGDLLVNGPTAVSLSGSLLPQGWNGTNNGGDGWGHNSSWYRLQVTNSGSLNIHVAGTAAGVQPAFSVWSSGNSGIDTDIGGVHSYSQVGNTPWSEADGLLTFAGLANNNAGGCGALGSCGNSYGVGPGPAAQTGASASIGNSGGFNYADLLLPNVAAGTWYLVAVGGSGGNAGGYTISAKVSAVPIPGALWLFGGGMASLVGFGKRKRNVGFQ